MKLRKNEIKVPMKFSVSPWEIPFSSVGKSIFMPMKILSVLKRTKTKMRQSPNDSDASSPITY